MFFKNVAVSQPREKSARPTRGHIYVKCLTTATSFGCCKVLDVSVCVCVLGRGDKRSDAARSTEIQRFAVFFVFSGVKWQN